MATVAGTKPHPIYLAGQWVESSDPLVVTNPAKPDEPAGEPEGALILLHGRGVDETDLFPLLDEIDPERRLLGLTLESDRWRPWTDGYTEVLVLLEHGDTQAAIARYRRIYAEVRADLESGEAAAQGLEAACPDPLR